MSRNFNRLRRFWFLLRADPAQQALWSGYLLLLCLTPFSPLFLLPALLWAALWLLLCRSAPRGRPRWLSRPLTPNFYALRSPFGWMGVFQRPAGPLPCRDLILGLCKEQIALPAALPPGLYRAVTHETVLHRLERMERAHILRKEFAYSAPLSAIYHTMTGGACRRCQNPCRLYSAAGNPRPFFFVVFQVLP